MHGAKRGTQEDAIHCTKYQNKSKLIWIEEKNPELLEWKEPSIINGTLMAILVDVNETYNEKVKLTNFKVHSYETYKYQWNLQKAMKLTSNNEAHKQQ